MFCPVDYSCKLFFDRSLTTEYEVLIYGQATKGKWWMPWRQEAMKDVVSCEKPRGAAKRALIRGYPNGVTQPE
jgi:ribosome modulation factor